MGEKSVWPDTSTKANFPELNEDISATAVVVGGGIAGITTAYMLEEKGIDTVLLEKDKLAEKVSGHTTAKITALQETIYTKLTSTFDKEKAQNYANAQKWALEKIKQLVDANNIACNFQRSPSYTYALEKNSRDKVHSEFKAAQNAGLDAKLVEDTDLPFGTFEAVKLENQARLQPHKYFIGLAENTDAAIFEKSGVKSVKTGKKHVVEIDSGSVTADHLILATQFPLLDKGMYFARMEPKYSYNILAKLKPKKHTEGMYINPQSNFRSIRPGPFKNTLIIGGEGHPSGKGDSTKKYRKLEKWAKENFPVESIEYKWSTQDYSTFDNLPHIGKLPLTQNIYIATGFKGGSMTNRTVAGKIISELITKDNPEWQDLYKPSRLGPKSIKTLSKLISKKLNTGNLFLKNQKRTKTRTE